MKKTRNTPQFELDLKSEIMFLLLALNGEWNDEREDFGIVINDRHTFANRRAVAALIGRFQALRLESSRAPGSTGPSKGMRAINRLLRRYVVVPRIYSAGDKKSDTKGWRYSFAPVNSGLAMEFEIVHGIISLASRGLLDRIRQCDDCKKWMYASRGHQRFCKTECKDHFHTFNEADKKRRRDWARTQYRTAVDRDKAYLRMIRTEIAKSKSRTR